MTKRKSVVHNVLANGSLNIFNVLLPFIVTPYVYRILGPINIGSFEYAMSIFGYFSTLGLLGIYDYGVRAISSNRDNLNERDNIFKNLFVTGLLSNLFVLAVYITLIYFYINDELIRTISFILCLNIFVQAIQVEWFNVGMEEFKFITLKTMLIRLLNVLAMFLLIKSSEDIIIYAILVTSVVILNYLISFTYVIKIINRPLKYFFTNLNLKYFIAPLIIILILKNTSILYTLTDRLLLGYFTGPENVAFFSIGQKIIELTKALLLSVVFATIPRLAYYLKTDKSLYQRNLLKVIRLIICLGIPTGIGLFLLSEDIVRLFGGEKFIPAAMAMRIFSLRVIMSCVESVLYSQILFLHGKEKRLIMYSLTCGLINLILNLLFRNKLTPFMSISITLFSEIIFNSLQLSYIHFVLKIQTGLMRYSTVRYFLISTLFFPVVWYIKLLNFPSTLTIAIVIPICGFIYFVLLALFKDKAYNNLKHYAISAFLKKHDS